jgi:hypothetical protein
LSQAIIDVSRFTDFDAVMGSTAPARADVLQALTTASSWTSQYQATLAWLRYVGLMQGLSWQVIRTQEQCLRPAFALAAKRNPALGEKYSGFAKLLFAQSKAAQQAVATKMANKKDIADGKPPSHGKVGKRATRAAQKAALLAQQAAAKATPAAPTPAAAAPANGAPPAAGTASGH